MKYIAIFMVSITLCLSLIPCSDEADKADGYTYKNAMAHSDSGDPQDGCTPFCTCNCCAYGVALSFNTYQIVSPTVYSCTNTLLFDKGEFLEFYHSIWQPPKISLS